MPTDRRTFLQLLTSGAAAAAFPSSIGRALAIPANHRTGSIADVEHIVFMMQENRSFDHYFGTLRGVRGYGDPRAVKLPSGDPVWQQPSGSSYVLPFHPPAPNLGLQFLEDLAHDWTTTHDAWNTGKYDQWVPSKGALTMAHLTRSDIPFHYALAENFTICDNYHCSLLGPTWPNRLYHLSAWIDPAGVGGGPIISNTDTTPYQWQSYPEALTAAGVPWQVYQEVDNYECNILEMFNSFQTAPVSSTLYQSGMRTFSSGQFEYDAMHDRLPAVSWLIPTSYQSEHPDYTPAAGADFVASKIDAIAANPDVWAKTVFILNYDENDGLFDHVVPPTAPAGTAGEYVDGLPIGAGFRVPCLIISPWTQGGWIASETFDHTSVLQFLETLTGVTIPNITPWRRATFGDLTSAFGAYQAGSRFPRLPDTKAALAQSVREVTTLPAPVIPTTNQTPPVQQTGPRPRPRGVSA